jgi:hypothetical protein
MMTVLTKFHSYFNTYKVMDHNYKLLALHFLQKAVVMTHHCAVGFDCMDLTPPSTGTATVRFSRGDGEAMAWLLYL